MADNAALRVQNMVIVREYLDAINANDFVKERALLDKDALFEFPYAPSPINRVLRGAEAIFSFVEQTPEITGPENLHDIWMDTLAGDPGEIVCTYKSDMEIKPTGKPYRNRYITRWSVRDGKIVYFAEFYDGIALVEALGGNVDPARLDFLEDASG